MHGAWRERQALPVVSYWNNYERLASVWIIHTLALWQQDSRHSWHFAVQDYWSTDLEATTENSMWSSKNKISSFQTFPNAASISNGLTVCNNHIHVCTSGQPTILPLSPATPHLTANFSSMISRWFPWTSGLKSVLTSSIPRKKKKKKKVLHLHFINNWAFQIREWRKDKNLLNMYFSATSLSELNESHNEEKEW